MNLQRLIEQLDQIRIDAREAMRLHGDPGGVAVKQNAAAEKVADDIHKDMCEAAYDIMQNYIVRKERSPAEVIDWTRPLLENLNISFLTALMDKGFAQLGQRNMGQYREAFQRRVEILIRNSEGKEAWISAGEAARLLKPGLGSELMAQMSLCKRAHAGLVRSKAQRLTVAGTPRDDVELPPFFWWAEGHEALHQNWRTGDFDTWVRGDDLPRELRQRATEVHFEAFNVSFLRSDVLKLIPPDVSLPPAPKQKQQAATPTGGRPPADWWDDLWVEMCRQLYGGHLIPAKQADIEKAMLDWLATRGENPSTSTIRDRARKLWRAIKPDEK